MSKIVNLRQARKAKARGEKESMAAANRAKHGVAKSARTLDKAISAKDQSNIDAHKLDKE